MFKSITKIWKNFRKQPCFPHERIERKLMNIDQIRMRLTSLGWTVREYPIRTKHTGDEHHEISSWKLTAVRGDKLFNVSGKTLDDSFLLLGKTLGVISDKDKS